MPATPFLVLADGASPRVERLEWLTDVQISRNGTEHRRALRALPRWSQSGQLVLLDDYRGGQISALEPILAGQAVTAPCWMHQIPVLAGGATTADAIVRASTVADFLAVPPNAGPFPAVALSVGASRGIAAANPATQLALYPLLEMRCTDGIDAEARSPGVRVMQLTLTATSPLNETVDAWTDVGDNELPNFPVRLNGREAVRDAAAFSAKSFDAGHLWSWEPRYSKRTVSGLISLLSRAEIIEMRRFLYAVRGRAVAFNWHCPLDDEPKLWRFASDSLELAYTTPSIAELRFSATEVAA